MSHDFAKYFHQGAIPLVHPDLIDFRPEDVSNNAFKKRNYIPERERALKASQSVKDIYFVEGEKFDQKDPNKKPNYRPVEK